MKKYARNNMIGNMPEICLNMQVICRYMLKICRYSQLYARNVQEICTNRHHDPDHPQARGPKKRLLFF